MKKLIKTIVSLTAASAMLLSTTAFAATTKTVTSYSASGTTVTSTVSGLTENSMVTYLAVKGENEAVSANGDNIVYIGQETVGSSKSATFTYKLNEQPAVGATYATIKYGSNVDAISSTNTVSVAEVAVTYDEALVSVSGNIVGEGQEANITIAAIGSNEIVKITKNGEEVEIQNTIKANVGDEIVVKAIPTEGNAAVYQLKGATLETASGEYTNSGIVRVIGNVGEVYFQFKNGDELYSMEGETKFSISDIVTGGGYYGVEVVDTYDISAYDAVAYADAEVIVIE